MNTPPIELCDERECQQLEAFLVERIYQFNARATGYFDGRLVGGRLRNEAGEGYRGGGVTPRVRANRIVNAHIPGVRVLRASRLREAGCHSGSAQGACE